MQELAMASDAQLRTLAQYKSRRDFANSPNRKAEYSLSKALPVWDSFFVGAVTILINFTIFIKFYRFAIIIIFIQAMNSISVMISAITIIILTYFIFSGT